jgi:hypothetical protein
MIFRRSDQRKQKIISVADVGKMGAKLGFGYRFAGISAGGGAALLIESVNIENHRRLSPLTERFGQANLGGYIKQAPAEANSAGENHN